MAQEDSVRIAALLLAWNMVIEGLASHNVHVHFSQGRLRAATLSPITKAVSHKPDCAADENDFPICLLF
jgi:hypothetical protein